MLGNKLSLSLLQKQCFVAAAFILWCLYRNINVRWLRSWSRREMIHQKVQRPRLPILKGPLNIHKKSLKYTKITKKKYQDSKVISAYNTRHEMGSYALELGWICLCDCQFLHDNCCAFHLNILKFFLVPPLWLLVLAPQDPCIRSQVVEGWQTPS